MNVFSVPKPLDALGLPEKARGDVRSVQCHLTKGQGSSPCILQMRMLTRLYYRLQTYRKFVLRHDVAPNLSKSSVDDVGNNGRTATAAVVYTEEAHVRFRPRVTQSQQHSSPPSTTSLYTYFSRFSSSPARCSGVEATADPPTLSAVSSTGPSLSPATQQAIGPTCRHSRQRQQRRSSTT